MRFVVRSWIRQALRASGVAILVPAAVAAAIALSVLGGGRNTGSLGEVLRGPAVPPAEAFAERGQSPNARPRATGVCPQTCTRAKRGQTPEVRAPLGGQSPEVRRRRPAPSPPVHTPPVRRPQWPAPRPPAAPAPPPAPPAAHPIHDAGTQVAETLRPLPIAGPVAADAVQAVVSLVDPA